MKKKYMLVLISVLLVGSTLSVSAAGLTGDGIKSRGRIYFNNKTPNVIEDDMVFDSGDLLHIADRIDVLTKVYR